MQKSIKFIAYLFILLGFFNCIFAKHTFSRILKRDTSSFQVVLREGIVGGFVPPTVRQVVDIKGDHSGVSISHSKLKSGSRTEYNTLSGVASFEDISGFLDNLKQQLKQLPTEDPIGSEDIYGQDTSISFFSDNFQWYNGGPGGCVHGVSNVQATDKQKEKFKQLIDEITGLGQQYATNA